MLPCSQHDVQLDYYGKQLASAGSDRRSKIFDIVDGNQRQQTAELTGHEGPVWQVAWAHPEFGKILASCSYDRQVFVWKEHAPQHWGLVHKFLGHGTPRRSPPPPPRETKQHTRLWAAALAFSAHVHYVAFAAAHKHPRP